MKPHPKVSPEKYRLAEKLRAGQYGAAVEIVAKPIARVVDRVIGTNLTNCVACAKRRERWNK